MTPSCTLQQRSGLGCVDLVVSPQEIDCPEMQETHIVSPPCQETLTDVLPCYISPEKPHIVGKAPRAGFAIREETKGGLAGLQ